jgi:hypothetical protein
MNFTRRLHLAGGVDALPGLSRTAVAQTYRRGRSRLSYRSLRGASRLDRAYPGRRNASLIRTTGYYRECYWRRRQRLTSTRFQFVPYRGTSPAMQELVAGQIDFMFDSPIDALPQLPSGNIKAYAVMAKGALAHAHLSADFNLHNRHSRKNQLLRRNLGSTLPPQGLLLRPA